MSRLRVWFAILLLLVDGTLSAAEHRGVVTLGTLPIPGATVTAQQGNQTRTALTDAKGAYVFADLPEGSWKIQVEMRGFAPVEGEVRAPGDAAAWKLVVLPLAKIAEAGESVQVRTGEAPAVSAKSKVKPPAATN